MNSDTWQKTKMTFLMDHNVKNCLKSLKKLINVCQIYEHTWLDYNIASEWVLRHRVRSMFCTHLVRKRLPQPLLSTYCVKGPLETQRRYWKDRANHLLRKGRTIPQGPQGSSWFFTTQLALYWSLPLRSLLYVSKGMTEKGEKYIFNLSVYPCLFWNELRNTFEYHSEEFVWDWWCPKPIHVKVWQWEKLEILNLNKGTWDRKGTTLHPVTIWSSWRVVLYCYTLFTVWLCHWCLMKDWDIVPKHWQCLMTSLLL